MASSRTTNARWRTALVAMAAGLMGLVAAGAPASAEAAMQYEGGTGQGKPMKLRTNDRGVVNRVRIRARFNCTNGARIEGGSIFFPPFQRRNPVSFKDVDKVTSRDRGFRLVIRDSITGRFVNENKRRIKGRYLLTANIFRGGQRINRCTVRTRWRAGLVS